jgi:RND family efflux transporter MFP subunit
MQPSNFNTEQQQPHVYRMTPKRATERRIRRFAVIVTIVLILGFVATFVSRAMHHRNLAAQANEAASAAPRVMVTPVAPSPTSVALKLPGETAAWYESVIYARVDGYVGKWMADIGDTVKKGQVLAVIETPELDAQLVAAKAKLSAAEAMLKARQAEAELARTTYGRWKDAPKGVVSEQERETKKAGYASGVAASNEAKAQVSLAQADVSRYSTLSQFKQVTAPYDGKIMERRVDIGNLVTAGSNTNTTPMYRIAQYKPMRVFINAPQSAANDMKPGTAVEIQSSSVAGEVFKGKISRTADSINNQARTLRVEVDLDNKRQLLVPGMYVDASFAIPTQGLVTLPAAAILFRAEGSQVGLVGADNHIHFVPVVIARDDGTNVVLQSGVKEGDRVALNINNQITEGQVVQPVTEQETHAKVASN